MHLVVVSIRDSAAQVFSRPVFVVAAGQAVRSFTDEVNRVADGNEINRHPTDFDLYQVGSFNDQDGVLVPLDKPILLIRGKDAAVRRE